MAKTLNGQKSDWLKIVITVGIFVIGLAIAGSSRITNNETRLAVVEREQTHLHEKVDEIASNVKELLRR